MKWDHALWSLEGINGLLLEFSMQISGVNAPVGVIGQFSL